MLGLLSRMSGAAQVGTKTDLRFWSERIFIHRKHTNSPWLLFSNSVFTSSHDALCMENMWCPNNLTNFTDKRWKILGKVEPGGWLVPRKESQVRFSLVRCHPGDPVSRPRETRG